MQPDDLLDRESVPDRTVRESIDVRELPPPEPLQRTLERLQELEEDELLIQVNDRVPQHLFPLLRERGYEFETSDGEPTYTAIWQP